MECTDLEIERAIDTTLMRWPSPSEASSEGHLGGNCGYADLRRMSWREAEEALEEETVLVKRIEQASHPEAEEDAILDELYEDPDSPLFGLDIGVASAAISLSAAGCIPCASCNGGVFGGRHHETHPLVVFYVKPEIIPPLLEIAEKRDVGLENAARGTVMLYAPDVHRMMCFAEDLIANSAVFRIF